MFIVRHSDTDYAAQLDRATTSSSMFDPKIESRAREILEAVRTRGDAALLEFTSRFDGANLSAEGIAVSRVETLAASVSAGTELRSAVTEASKNITAFSRRSRRRDWSSKNSHGGVVGEVFQPFQRVGIYIPGGTAPLVSTALMTITLAKVAGCPEIVVCTPCDKEGSINSALLFAAVQAGATEIHRLGGAQAIAAMAYGTQSIRRVNKVFGPGNAYVVAAKRLLFGQIAIDLLPGPSEVLVLADDTADPRSAAADLLAQAEHGSGHERVWLVTPSLKVLKAVDREIQRQLPTLKRRGFIQRALDANGWLIQVPDMETGVALANRLAPEHCELMIRDARKWAAQIRTAGALFLGNSSPTVLGDYVAGPSHTLPTGGGGASFAGLTVDQFQRRTSVIEYGRPALKKALGAVRCFAGLEGLDAHGRSADIRFSK
ncbi:MAG: histidinol dehydrogenase [Pedosphaera sp.]|nr:histidinol dehydrogenase [Pedosphaera sp.]